MIKFHRPSSFIAPHDTPAAERTLMQKIFHKKKDDLPPAERRGIQIDADRSSRTKLLCGLIPMGHKETLTNLTVEPSREVDCSSDRKKLGDAISKIQDHFSRIKKLNYSTDTMDLSLDKALLPVIVAAENHKKPELNLQYFNHVPSFLSAIKSKNFKEGRFLFPMPGHLIHVVSADIKKIDGKLSILIIDPVNVANKKNKLLDAYQFGMAPIFTNELPKNSKITVLSLDLQRSPADCVIFSLSMASKFEQEKNFFNDLHKSNIVDGENMGNSNDQSSVLYEERNLRILDARGLLPASFQKHIQSAKALDYWVSKRSNPLNYNESEIVNSLNGRVTKNNANRYKEQEDEFGNVIAGKKKKISLSTSIEEKRIAYLGKAKDYLKYASKEKILEFQDHFDQVMQNNAIPDENTLSLDKRTLSPYPSISATSSDYGGEIGEYDSKNLNSEEISEVIPVTDQTGATTSVHLDEDESSATLENTHRNLFEPATNIIDRTAGILHSSKVQSLLNRLNGAAEKLDESSQSLLAQLPISSSHLLGKVEEVLSTLSHIDHAELSRLSNNHGEADDLARSRFIESLDRLEVNTEKVHNEILHVLNSQMKESFPVQEKNKLMQAASMLVHVRNCVQALQNTITQEMVEKAESETSLSRTNSDTFFEIPMNGLSDSESSDEFFTPTQTPEREISSISTPDNTVDEITNKPEEKKHREGKEPVVDDPSFHASTSATKSHNIPEITTDLDFESEIEMPPSETAVSEKKTKTLAEFLSMGDFLERGNSLDIELQRQQIIANINDLSSQKNKGFSSINKQIKHIGKFAGSILEKNENGHIRIKSIYSCRLSQSTQLDRYLSPNALSDLIKNEVSYLFEKGVPPDTIAQTIAQSKAFKNLKLSNKNDVLKQAIFSGMGLFEGRPL